MDPTPASVAAALRCDAAEAALTPHWAEACAARPAGLPAFLDPATIPARRAALALDPACDAPLAAIAAEVAGDPALAAAAWYLHWRLWRCPHPGCPASFALDARLNERTGAFWLLLTLDFAAELAAAHRARGYPAEVTAACLDQVAGYLDNWRRTPGHAADVVGCHPGQACWLRTYLDFPYVRLGRLSFQLMPFNGAVAAFRHRRSGAVVALARDRMRIDADGLVARVGQQPAWTCTLRVDARGACGHPVDPAGAVQRRQVLLPANEWALLLAKDDPILSIHIPPGGAMDLAAVEDSFRRAQAFFARHHGDRPARALWCSTWFLDPRLGGLLRPDANPLRLQRSLYLHPVDPWDGGLWFVFLMPTDDPARLPRATSLQRALAGFLERGGRWNCGGAFIPLDEAGTLEEGRYAARFAAALPATAPGG